MKIYIVIIIILHSVTLSNTFSTSLGQCSIQIHEGEVAQITELINLVKLETNRLSKILGEVKPRPFTIYITSNMDEFNKQSKGPSPEWGIAVAKKNPDRIILKDLGIANISFARMKEVIIHELNHIYMFRIPQYRSIPSWFKEGMAMQSANEFSLLHKIEISQAILERKIIPLLRLQNISLYKYDKVKLAYGESVAAVEAMEYYYGKNININLIEEMKNGDTFIEAFKKISNDTISDFQIKFETYLEENYRWIFLFRSTRYIYIILPFILILGFIYYRYKRRLIIAKWEIEEQLENIK
tara:strand:+ start:2899 stop:3792 length:894 start_codon:yes stop_codon:yes gene_type:complete